MRAKVKQELDHLHQQGIIEPVQFSDSVMERALLEDYNSREHSRHVIRVLIYHRLTLQLYNHDFIHNILINAHDYIIFISNTTVSILFTTLPG